MYVQVPIFPGFSNIGICPGPFPGISVCILDKIEKTDHLSNDLKEITFKYLPYYQNHVYILFPDSVDRMGKVLYYGSDGDLQRYLHYHLGSRQVCGRYLNVSVTKEWVPHLTAPLEFFEFMIKSKQENVNQSGCMEEINSERKRQQKKYKIAKKQKKYLNQTEKENLNNDR